jgi:hypothetical protein
MSCVDKPACSATSNGLPLLVILSLSSGSLVVSWWNDDAKQGLSLLGMDNKQTCYGLKLDVITI